MPRAHQERAAYLRLGVVWRERINGGVRPTVVKRSLLRALGMVPVLFAALLVLPTTSASACSCARMTPAQATETADVVLRGTLSDIHTPSRLELLRSSQSPARYTFDVAEVFKGRTRETAEVRSLTSSASCGIEGLLPGREYVLFTQVRGEQLWVGLCGGSDLASRGLVADVEQVTGPGQLPVPPGLIDEAAPLPGEVAGDNAWLVPLVGGGVLAVVLAGLLLRVVRRGRRRG